MTRSVSIDIKTGEVDVPPESRYFSLCYSYNLTIHARVNYSLKLPKGKPWRDVIRYEGNRREA